MNIKKHTGSYYTPKLLTTFIVNHLFSKHSKKIKSILEPSSGDGVFIKSILERDISNMEIDAIEKNKDEFKKSLLLLKDLIAIGKAKVYNADFLSKYYDLNKKYDLIIGNPPYIKKNYLLDYQIEKCKAIHKKANLSEEVKNIWTAFLIACADLIKLNGILAFVLPAELLQVKFTSEIREYMRMNFDRIEIFTFDQLLFNTQGQDTVLFIGYKKSENKGVYYTNIKKVEDLSNNEIHFNKNDVLLKNYIKWTHHFLTSEELDLIERVKSKFNRVNEVCISKPGIVTAANNYFIVTEDILDEYDLRRFAKPIIQRGLFVNGAVEFRAKDLVYMIDNKIPSYFLEFEDKALKEYSPDAKSYIKKGYTYNLNHRYKMTCRNRWYVVPNIVKASDGFFFKRSHLYPKLLKNNAKILTTDSAYNVTMKKGYSINSMIYSFYNSLTLLCAELQGRFYGGGVLELTPSEFKNLPIPYSKISSLDFQLFANKFKNKVKIEEILIDNDEKILSEYGIKECEIIMLQSIRGKLVNKRLKKVKYIPS